MPASFSVVALRYLFKDVPPLPITNGLHAFVSIVHATQAAEKPSFRRLVGRRHGVVAFTGFYEWKQDEKGERQPYYFHFKDDRPLLVRARCVCLRFRTNLLSREESSCAISSCTIDYVAKLRLCHSCPVCSPVRYLASGGPPGCGRRYKPF